jgi:group I intron endonuclease
MANKLVQYVGDIIDFGFYIKAKPIISTKIDNLDFKKFCEEHADLNINYKITNAPGIYAFKKKALNKVVYVGQAFNLRERIGTHGKDAFNQNLKAFRTRLHSAFHKYGPQAFEVEILAVLNELDSAELDRLEKEFIDKYNTFRDASGYNLTPGGQDNSSGLAARFKMTSEADVAIVNSIREFLLKAERESTYLTPESAVSTIGIEGLTPGVLKAINEGRGVYYDKKYNGPDIRKKKSIYSFASKKSNVPATDENVLCTVFVKNKDLVPRHLEDDNIIKDHAGRPLVFVGCPDACKYINQTFNWYAVDARSILNMAKGARKTHSLISQYVGDIVQVTFPIEDYKRIAENSKAILQDIRFKQIYVNCIVMIDVDTAEEYRFKTTYGCAVFLAEHGKIDMKDKNGVAGTLKSIVVDKNKERYGYMFFTEKITLQDYYKLS